MTIWKRLLGPLVGAALAASLLACGPTREDVENDIASANHCTVPQDCVSAGSFCPFGCHVLVYTTEATRIRERIDEYYDAHPGEQCMYDCMALSGIDCVSGKCEAVLDNP